MKSQKPTLIETEAQDHAVETRYAVKHHGKELHPDAKRRKGSSKHKAEAPWQLD